MTMPTPVVDRLKNNIGLMPVQRSQSQHGVVLIIALVLLVIISLLAVSSIRNAGSSESVSSNVRTTELATHAAEIALRYCEAKVLAIRTTPPSTTEVFKIFPKINPPTNPLYPYKWQDTTSATGWDSSSETSLLHDISLNLVNKDDVNHVKYQRPPEFIAETLDEESAAGAFRYVITARGFGPEVLKLDVKTQRVRPIGTEVWLQSTIELQ